MKTIPKKAAARRAADVAHTVSVLERHSLALEQFNDATYRPAAAGAIVTALGELTEAVHRFRRAAHGRDLDEQRQRIAELEAEQARRLRREAGRR